MTSKDIECFECKYGENCPVFWSRHNAACLTIRKEKEKYEERLNQNYKTYETLMVDKNKIL